MELKNNEGGSFSLHRSLRCSREFLSEVINESKGVGIKTSRIGSREMQPMSENRGR